METNPLFESEIEFESNLPLHYQIMMLIKRNIASNKIRPGDQLPTEEEFCKAYNVSRSTIRNAIGELVDEGLVTRIRGKGTYISKKKLMRRMEQVYSFSHQMESIGLAPSSELLEFKIVKKDEVLANLFGIKDIEPVYKIVRLRKANGDPLLLETTFIPAKYHPGLDANKLVDGSLYDMLRDDAKILPHTAEETYESIVFEKHISNLLKCAQRSSGFYIERITRMESGEIYELTQSFMRGDRSKIAIKLQQDVYTFNRSIE